MPKKLSWITRFLCGAAGAFTLIAYGLWKLSIGALDPNPRSLIYYIMSLVMVICGGIFATLFQDDSHFHNYYFGLSIFAFISKYSL